MVNAGGLGNWVPTSSMVVPVFRSLFATPVTDTASGWINWCNWWISTPRSCRRWDDLYLANRHGIDLLPVLEYGAATRNVAVSGMFGQSVSLTDGDWMLHQAPGTQNQPLYWYGLQDWHFVKNGTLGPVVRGRREVRLQRYQFAEPTWLSDLGHDPAERENAAQREGEELERMQRLLKHELMRLGAPNRISLTG